MTDDFRIAANERDITDLQQKVAVIPVLETKIENMGREIGELKVQIRDGFAEQKEDNKATRRVTMGFAFAVSGSCVAVLLTLLTTGVI